MKTRVDARLREETERLRFRFACEDCAHFVPDLGLCSLGYPASPRRAELAPAADVRELELCKSFELA